MCGFITALAVAFLSKEIIKEKLEQPATTNQWFDWEKYWDDVNTEVETMEIVKRRGNGCYYTTKLLPQPRYQNRLKQAMWEQYQKELNEYPEYAALKVKHGNYGGFVFDDTEN